MSNENDAVKTAIEKISSEANHQILSHCIMALKQNIEDRLKEGGDANLIFENKIKLLYDEDTIKSSNHSHKAYVYLDDLIRQDKNNAYARIYSKIDKVLSVEDNSISYALHLRIASHGTGTTSYNEGFITEDCGRFAIGHDIEHAFLDLNDLIRNATTNDNQNITKSETTDNTVKYREYEADFFSYMLSDLRDFCRFKLPGELDLDKALESYKGKIISKNSRFIFKEMKKRMSANKQANNKINDIIEEIFKGIKKVFEASKKLYYDSLQYTMSHPIIALNKIINSEFQSKIYDELEKLRKKLEEKSEEYEFEKISIMSIENIPKNEIEKRITNIINIEKQMDKLTEQMDDLENKNPRINIHLISKEEYSKELTIDCYNRRDDSSGKDFYCFEVIIKKFSGEEERNNRSKEICKAIGFIYFGYKLIVERFENNNELGHLMISGVQQGINDFGLNKEEINDFANELCKLWNDNFKDKCKKIENESKLKNRLIGYVV